MSKLNCINCKYYDFNACDGVDWCKLNHEETGICGNCDREFEDLEEATTHYDAIVEENNTFLMENSKMAGEIKDLQHRLEVAEIATKLACKEELRAIGIYDDDLDYKKEMSILEQQYKEQAEEELKGE